MKNDNLLVDLDWLRSAHDTTMTAVADGAQEYIEHLEGRDERLTKIEAILEHILNADTTDLPNKDVFLAKFKEFLNEVA